MQAYAPSFPGTRQERWFFVLANTAANAVLSVQGVNLLRAEAAGVARTLGGKPLLDHGCVAAEPCCSVST